jgi:prevent-host-death family protein
MFMTTVGVAQLRQNLGEYLRRGQRGERLLVTDRNRPVAMLGPLPAPGVAFDRLIDEGRVRRPLPEPLDLGGVPSVLSRALVEIRGES